MEQPDPIEAAIRRFPNRIFRHGERAMTIACLIRTADWRPLDAPWWRGKGVCIIGADLDGNFFLRHCDGSVRYWDHQVQADTVIAPSVREFVAKIE
jgi:hypothetical protein